jgi:uncharacterized protein HemX
MDWTLLKAALEAAVLFVLLPGAAYYLFLMQKRHIRMQELQIQDRDEQIEAHKNELNEKGDAIRTLQKEISAEKEKFRAFTEELISRNKQAWNRFLDDESTVIRAAQEEGVGALEEHFEAFNKKLSSVQDDLANFRHTLVGTYQAFFNERRRSIEAKGIPSFLYSELVAEMRVKYQNGRTSVVGAKPGNGSLRV